MTNVAQFEDLPGKLEESSNKNYNNDHEQEEKSIAPNGGKSDNYDILLWHDYLISVEYGKVFINSVE